MGIVNPVGITHGVGNGRTGFRSRGVTGISAGSGRRHRRLASSQGKYGREKSDGQESLFFHELPHMAFFAVWMAVSNAALTEVPFIKTSVTIPPTWVRKAEEPRKAFCEI